jgi:hypothetical protein
MVVAHVNNAVGRVHRTKEAGREGVNRASREAWATNQVLKEIEFEDSVNFLERLRLHINAELAHQAAMLRDIFGNPFRPIAHDRSWLTSTVLALAHQMYDTRDFSAMPTLADALQEAGCDNIDILNHCRGPGPHVRGRFVVDQLLGKE